MIWTTAGTNRVCSRCLALKDTVVGYTDELGVLLPPLHPRCRCAIMYDEVGTPRATRPKPTINPLLPAAVATEIISPATPEPQTTPQPEPKPEVDIKEQHRALALQSEQLETRWRTLQNEIEHMAPRGYSPRLDSLYTEQKQIGDKLWETEKNLHKIRFAAAEKGVILTTSLSRSLDADNIKAIVEQVRTAPKNLRILWNMAEADMPIIDKNFRGTSHYDLNQYGILFDAAEDFYNPNRKCKKLLHETGHLIDHFMGHQMYLYSFVYEGGAFKQSLIDEANAAVRAELARLKSEAVALGRSAKDIKLADAQRSLSETLRKIDHAVRSEVSDIFSGATKNKVNGGYKHETKYWQEKETLPAEAFAHMFCASIQSTESLEYIRRYFPKSYQMFEEMTDEWIKEIKTQWIGKSSTACLHNMMNVLKSRFLQSKCRRKTSKMR